MKLEDANIRVIAEVMGARYEVKGVADISDGINHDWINGMLEFDADLITGKIKQELAARLREMADKLEADA